MAYFKDHEIIGGFKITRSLECKLSQELPIFIPENVELREDLSDGFDTALKINDYEERKEPKQRFFLEWLINNNFHRGVIEKTFKRPSFICYGGRITEPLSTKAFWGSKTKWEIYAAKFNDAIYLWREDYYNSNVGKDFLKPSPHYYNSRFRHLLTTEDVNDCVVNEFDKLHTIQQVSFDTHQILCLNVFADAKTVDDELMAFQTYKPLELQNKKPKVEIDEPWVQNYGFRKSLRVWAQCKVGGIPKVVLGERLSGESDYLLNDVNIVATDDLATPWNLPIPHMYYFLDRILTRISSELEENDPKVVKKFTWAEGSLTVDQADENDTPATMLPDWYIQSVEEQVAAT